MVGTLQDVLDRCFCIKDGDILRGYKIEKV